MGVGWSQPCLSRVEAIRDLRAALDGTAQRSDHRLAGHGGAGGPAGWPERRGEEGLEPLGGSRGDGKSREEMNAGEKVGQVEKQERLSSKEPSRADS